MKGDKRFLSHFALTLAAEVRFVAESEKKFKNNFEQQKSTWTISLYCPCAFLIVPAILSEKPHSEVYFTVEKTKIFLTVILLLKKTDGKYLSKRLPPIAAKNKMTLCLHCEEKKKRRLFNRRSKEFIKIRMPKRAVNNGFFINRITA